MTRLLWSTRITSLSKGLRGKTPRLRLEGNVSARTRGMASESHAHGTSSDTPWIVGSAVVFGPALLYLLGPGSASVVTGHGEPSKDRHPSGHGSAPAPLMREDTAKQQPEEPAPKPEPEPIESEPDSERDKERSAQKSENSGDATDESHETPTQISRAENEEDEARASDVTTPSQKHDTNSEESEENKQESSQSKATEYGSDSAQK